MGAGMETLGVAAAAAVGFGSTQPIARSAVYRTKLSRTK